MPCTDRSSATLDGPTSTQDATYVQFLMQPFLFALPARFLSRSRRPSHSAVQPPPPPKKPLDKRYTDMITSAMLARQITFPKQANSFTPTLLQPLGSTFPASGVCFQQLAASFAKTPGWGVSLRQLSALCASALSFAVVFLRPLFSYSYKSLFPQTLSFHIHTKPPGVGVNYD